MTRKDGQPKGGKLRDAEWRRARAMKAGLANRAASLKRAIARASRFADKPLAYAAGYRAGCYNRDRYWRAKYQRALAQMRKAA